MLLTPPTTMRGLFAVLIGLLGVVAHAQGVIKGGWSSYAASANVRVEALGQPISFKNPKGYCSVGDSVRERGLMTGTQKALGPNVRLLHASVRCDELAEFKRGERDLLDHWIQIQLIGSKGEFQRVEMERGAFLSALAKATPRVTDADLKVRLRAAFRDLAMNMTSFRHDTIGRDGNAVYIAYRVELASTGPARTISGLGGVTLINAIPLSLNVYSTDDSAAGSDQLHQVHRELLMSILTEN